MKIILKTLASSMLFVSVYIFCCACFAPYAFKGGSIDGVPLKNKSVEEVEKILKEKYLFEIKQKRLEIQVEEKIYTFEYPQIDYQSNLDEIISLAIKNPRDYKVKRRFYLHQSQSVLEGICQNFAIIEQSASAQFTRNYDNPFIYNSGAPTRYINYERLVNDVENSLSNDFERVIAHTIYEQKTSVEQLKLKRVKLSEFSTAFNQENTARTHNVTLASKKINGIILEPNAEFSFNQTVGERSISNGFKNAPVIYDGEFVEGVGGGVCQVSTTLYNAALLSGLEIIEYHPHSLKVAYVAPSFDAMVSGTFADLKFKNTSDSEVYILSKIENGRLFISVYGKDNGITYERKSVKIKDIFPPEMKIVYGDEEKIIKNEKNGLESEGYLISYKNGVRTAVKKIRKDKYGAVQGIIQKCAKSVA